MEVRMEVHLLVVHQKEVEEDLKSAHNRLGRMERELWAAEDKNCPRRKAANPWQVGVPYGSGRSGR